MRETAADLMKTWQIWSMRTLSLMKEETTEGSRSTAVKGKKHFFPPFPIDPEMENTKTQTESQI